MKVINSDPIDIVNSDPIDDIDRLIDKSIT